MSDGLLLILALAAVLAFADSAAGVGILLPGEAAIVALTTTIETSQMALMVGAVAAGATAGDTLGYLLGRRLGSRLERSRIGQKVGEKRWDSASRLMQRHGATAVLSSRLIPFVRTLIPPLAGATGFALRLSSQPLLWAPQCGQRYG